MKIENSHSQLQMGLRLVLQLLFEVTILPWKETCSLFGVVTCHCILRCSRSYGCYVACSCIIMLLEVNSCVAPTNS